VIDRLEVERFVEDPGVGGIVTFSGTVRSRARGMDVIAIDYEAYEPAAEKMLARIGEEVFERWQISRLAIVHRTGYLAVGEVSVVISAGSPHRAEAFAAAEYAIDRIKEIVPIWKKEFYQDGSHWVGTEAEYQRQLKVAPIA
jgi:molybdopterin synthase catalytic subunit